jgi:hypothetical protein
MFTTKRSHDPAAQIYGVDNVDQKLTMSKRMDEKKITVARAATVPCTELLYFLRRSFALKEENENSSILEAFLFESAIETSSACT